MKQGLNAGGSMPFEQRVEELRSLVNCRKKLQAFGCNLQVTFLVWRSNANVPCNADYGIAQYSGFSPNTSSNEIFRSGNVMGDTVSSCTNDPTLRYR